MIMDVYIGHNISSISKIVRYDNHANGEHTTRMLGRIYAVNRYAPPYNAGFPIDVFQMPGVDESQSNQKYGDTPEATLSGMRDKLRQKLALESQNCFPDVGDKNGKSDKIAKATLSEQFGFWDCRTFGIIFGRKFGPKHLEQKQMVKSGISNEITRILDRWVNEGGNKAYLVNGDVFQYKGRKDDEVYNHIVQFDERTDLDVPDLTDTTLLVLKSRSDIPGKGASTEATKCYNVTESTVESHVADRDDVLFSRSFNVDGGYVSVGISKNKKHAGIYLNGYSLEHPIGELYEDKVPVSRHGLDYGKRSWFITGGVQSNQAFIDVRTDKTITRQKACSRAVNAFGKLFIDLNPPTGWGSFDTDQTDLIYDRIYDILKMHPTQNKWNASNKTVDVSSLLNKEMLGKLKSPERQSAKKRRDIMLDYINPHWTPDGAPDDGDFFRDAMEKRATRKHKHSGLDAVKTVVPYVDNQVHGEAAETYASIADHLVDREDEPSGFVYGYTFFLKTHPTLCMVMDPSGCDVAGELRRHLSDMSDVLPPEPKDHVDVDSTFDVDIFDKAYRLLSMFENDIEGANLAPYYLFSSGHYRNKHMEECFGDHPHRGLLIPFEAGFSVDVGVNFNQSVYAILQATMHHANTDILLAKVNSGNTVIRKNDDVFNVDESLKQVRRLVNQMVQDIGIEHLIEPNEQGE